MENNRLLLGIASAIATSIGAFIGIHFLSNNTAVHQDNDSTRSDDSTKQKVESPPNDPEIRNLNSLLADISARYITVKCDDFTRYYYVFTKIFNHLHQKMKDGDPYYCRYSSMVQFAGSHYDRLRIKKPDEFDMDVVIRAPLNIHTDPFNPECSDVNIEPKDPGYVYLNMGAQYLKIPHRDLSDWNINKTAYKWKDVNSNYLLQSKFLDWFKSVVAKALNNFDKNIFGGPCFEIDGLAYTVSTSQSGPAITLIIKSEDFKLDVDLVPALKFPESRWPLNNDYRKIPKKCEKGYWMVVPKANPNGGERDWRLALHYQERELLHDTYNLRPALRLVKKFRDTQELNSIASYYIKTLFFWEVVERNDPFFWRNPPAKIFRIMLVKLHKALVKGNIPYFWNEKNNLIQGVRPTVLNIYARKTLRLIEELENIELYPATYKNAARYLLTGDEYAEYYNTILKYK